MTDEKEFYDKIYHLKNVIRYNSRNVISKESVAEHTFNVAMIALTICDKYSLSKDVTFQTVVKALLHDMPETILNDITHDVKERLKLREILKKYEDEYYDKEFPQYSDLMKNRIEPIDSIVDLADAISVKQYIDNEIILGNRSEDVLEISQTTAKRISVLTKKAEKEIMYENRQRL